MPDTKVLGDILNKLKDDSEKELREAAKEVMNVGREAFKTFISDLKDRISSEDAKTLARLYAEAEVKILAYDSESAHRVMKRLNAVSRTYYNISRSQGTKQAIMVWKQSLKVLTSLASRLVGVAGGALGDGVAAGLEIGLEVIDDMAEEVSSKASGKSKKKSSKKKKDNLADDDIVIEES